MDRRVLEDRSRIGTVKAAVSKYGERILESNSSSLQKSQVDLHEENSSLRTRELHKSKRDLVRYKEGRRATESAKIRAESELLEAKKKVKDLAALIEESNMKVKDQMRDMERLKKSGKREDKTLLVGSADNHQYTEAMRELAIVKQELSELKLNMAAVVKEKVQAEKEMASVRSKLLSNMSSVEALRNKIDEVNEEQVLTELAQIEAMKELGEIQIRREKEAREFNSAMQETRKKIKDVREEIDISKELESKLTVAVYEANVLQNELELAKEMDRKVKRSESMNHLGGSFRQGKELDRKVRRSDSMNHLGGSFRKGKELGSSASLELITEELQVAKKELVSIREEGFQFMTSMDIIRSELNHVKGETARLKKAKEKADLTAQNLNSKLLRAKSKLETASAVEKEATSILSNLSLTLEQVKTETEVAKTEKKLISEETAKIKVGIKKTESQIDSTEEKLQVAIQELEAVKTSEALALDKLKNVIENTMKSRASAAQQSSSITISKFEYKYLTGHAAKAEEIADKKAAAAQAWIEALKASEKEILMKIELAHKEIRETRVEEEKRIYQTESSLSAKRRVEGELSKWRRMSKKSTESGNLQMPLSRKTTKANGNLTPSRRAKLRKSGSPAVRTTPRMTPRSTSITIRKKRTAVPNLSKLFIGKRINKDA